MWNVSLLVTGFLIAKLNIFTLLNEICAELYESSNYVKLRLSGVIATIWLVYILLVFLPLSRLVENMKNHGNNTEGSFTNELQRRGSFDMHFITNK